MLFEVLEHRMAKGVFTVIDATNIKTADIKRFKDLAVTYRYRIYVVDFTDVPIDLCKKQNAMRPEFKRVPESVSHLLGIEIPSLLETVSTSVLMVR